MMVGVLPIPHKSESMMALVLLNKFKNQLLKENKPTAD